MDAAPEHPSGADAPGAARADHIRGVRCPTCGSRRPWAGNEHRPFCSHVCRLIDLGRWLDERYRIESEPAPEEPGGNAR